MSGVHSGAPRLVKKMAFALALLLLVPMVTVSPWLRGVPAQAVIVDGVDWETLPAEATRIGDAPLDYVMSIYLGFANPLLPQAALAVSEPDSVQYGQYPALADAVAEYGASAQQENLVGQSLAAVETDQDISASRTFTRTKMTTSQAQEFFSVRFGLYSDPDAGQLIAPDSQPTLPAPLNGTLSAVYGLINGLDQGQSDTSSAGTRTPPQPPTPSTLSTPIRTGVPQGCEEGVAAGGFTPNQLATAYGYDVLHAEGTRGEGQRLAIVELNANVPETDMAEFEQCFGFDGATPLRQVNVGGDPDPNSYNVDEAVLDAQVVAQVAPKLDAFELYSFNDETLDLLEQFLELLAMPLDPAVYGTVPVDVVSFSYGLCEALLTDSTPFVTIGEQLLAMAAVSGITYVGPGGDNGSSGCMAADPANITLSPNYPGSSSWVTSVGGTGMTLSGPPYYPELPPNYIIVDSDTGTRHESVWNDTLYPSIWFGQGGGGGGTGILVPRPDWQSGTTVPSGDTRLSPDLAMYGDVSPGWTIYCTTGDCADSPGWQTIGGTSAAAPLVASLVALTNQAIDDNPDHPRPKLGFFNPYVYDIAERQNEPGNPMQRALLDVTTGNNDVAGVGCCDATVGYDIASGWGSIHAASLRSVVLGTPTRPTIIGSQTGYDSVILTADAPQSAGAEPISSYQFTLDSGTTWRDATVIGDVTANTVQLLLPDLDPATTASAWIRARNAQGPGLASEGFDVTTAGARFIPLGEPIRAVDTRSEGGPVIPGTPLTVDIPGLQGIGSAQVVAIAYNLTATGTQGSGFAVAYPAADSPPNSSTVNWTGANQTVANSFVSGVDDLKMNVAVAGTPSQIIVDVMGYYVLDDSKLSSLFVPTEPTRAYDSRFDSGPLPGGRSLTVPLSAHVPKGSTAAAYTVTITGTTGSGFLSVGLPGAAEPPTSIINWSGPRTTLANSAVAAVSSGQDPSIEVFANGSGSTEVVIDIIGYFAPQSVAPSGLQFGAIDPARAYDSRDPGSGGPIVGGEGRATTVEIPGVPSESQAVAMNLTVTGTSGSGFLSLNPGISFTPPSASTINWTSSNNTLANGTLIGVGDGDVTTLAGGRGSTEYLTDIAGYFTPLPTP